jgi:type I restriction enzyme S subunit
MWLSKRDRLQLRLESGDLLVSEGGDVGRSCLWAVELDDCYFQNSVNRVRARDANLNRYLCYWMSTIKDKGYIDVLCNKSTIAHFTAEKVAAVPVPFPPSEEQTHIAAFLDAETATIDELVAEQRRLMDLLKEKRQAVISHAVTKGLNPNAPMKASGIEWLGEVPEHWEITPLKWLTDPERQIMYGIVLPGPDVGEGIPVLKGGNVKPSRMNLASMARTTPEIEAPFARARLKAGDLVYAIRGTIGDCEPVPVELEAANITQDVARIALANGTCAGWARWTLLASAIREDLACGSLGAAVRGINIFDLKRVRIPTPPPTEQATIAAFLDTETTKLDTLTAEAQRAIDLLQERRTALISAAVTGQLDVRDVF